MRNAAKLGSSQENESNSRVSLFPGMEILEIGLFFEDEARASGFRFIAGIDEVGRGCLAGPVVAGACILDPAKPVPQGIDDSKKLTRQQREEIAEQLRAECVSYAIGRIEADEIDRINILEATKKAMLAAIDGLSQPADFLLIDALQLKLSPLPQKAIIKGDAISVSIAAASILAKTYRDKLMMDLDAEYPEYGFAGHKGYGAKVHLEALRVHGPCPLHRRSFRGVLPDTETESGNLGAG
jgi:ribonuclease HII